MQRWSSGKRNVPDVTTGLRICRDRVRALGYRVEEVPGWESRGKGLLTPRVAVNHHDAIPGPSPVAGLRLCTYGREGLRNALCNTYGERGPRAGIWIVAAGVAWHAGTGGWAGFSGNSRALGRENANDGRGEPWHPDALAVQRVWDRVQADVFGLPFTHYCEHREWTSRKPDRAGIAGHTWRQEIAALRLGSPIPRPPIQEEDMIVPIDVPPNSEQVLWLEPTSDQGTGFLGTKRALIVLTTHRPTAEAKVYIDPLGGGPGPVTILREHPAVWELRNTKPGRLHIRNLDPDWRIGGSVMYRR